MGLRMTHGRQRHRLGEDDGVAGSRMRQGQLCHRLRDDVGLMALQARGWHGVDSIAGLGMLWG
jgi:hypothetical protein